MLSRSKNWNIRELNVYRNNSTKNSKGISVKNNIKTISVEVSSYDEAGQTLCILLNNQKQKIRIRAIYGPQENMIPNNKLKLIYKKMAEQIDIAEEKYQQILMVRDFSVKIENHIPGNKKQYQKKEDSPK